MGRSQCGGYRFVLIGSAGCLFLSIGATVARKSRELDLSESTVKIHVQGDIAQTEFCQRRAGGGLCGGAWVGDTELISIIVLTPCFPSTFDKVFELINISICGSISLASK